MIYQLCFHILKGLMKPKLAVSGKELPLAREVSNKIFDRNNVPNPDVTVMFVVFGQFLDHDLSHVPVHTSKNLTLILAHFLGFNITCYQIKIPYFILV